MRMRPGSSSVVCEEMRVRFTARAVKIVIFGIAMVAATLTFILGCGGGGDAAEEIDELSIDEIWARAAEADAALRSWSMEIASYYENTQYGSGQIQSIVIDVNGEDIYERDLLLGQVYREFKRVEGRHYNKDVKSGAWVEVPAASTGDESARYTSHFLELPSLASSWESLGAQVIDERETEHFHFLIGPDGVKEMFSSQPSFDFSQSTGGEVDVWIDRDEYFLVRYELVICNVIIPEKIGRGDVRFVVCIRNINEPIEIAPPVS